MLKRLTVVAAAAAALTIPASGALAAPGTQAEGVLPDEACHAAYPAHLQPLLCGRGMGGPGSA